VPFVNFVHVSLCWTHLAEVSTRHLGEDHIESVLVIERDETIVKHTQRLVTKQTKDLLVVADYTWVGLQQPCLHTHSISIIIGALEVLRNRAL